MAWLNRSFAAVFALLDALADGRTLDAATELALDHDPQFELGEHLADLTNGGVIAWLG